MFEISILIFSFFALALASERAERIRFYRFNDKSIRYFFNPLDPNKREKFIKLCSRKYKFKIDDQVIIDLYDLHKADYKCYYRTDNDYLLFVPCGCNQFSVTISKYVKGVRELPISEIFYC